MHALSVGDILIHLAIDKEDVDHALLDTRIAEIIDVREAVIYMKVKGRIGCKSVDG